MEAKMYGVVLWADARDSKAVIWCEDHGNLAYYSAGEQSLHQDVPLDAGDLIEFELREDVDFRRARNLQRVDAGHAPSIARSLQRSSGCSQPGTSAQTGSNVVAFPCV